MLSASLLALGAPARAAESSDAASPESASGDSEGQIVVRGLHDDMESLAATKSPPHRRNPAIDQRGHRRRHCPAGPCQSQPVFALCRRGHPETRGASAEVYDQFKLRGFDAPVYLDGLKQFASASGYASPQVDMSRLDSIEVVKGPPPRSMASRAPAVSWR
jgi:iron complex outermembrane receptor protein